MKEKQRLRDCVPTGNSSHATLKKESERGGSPVNPVSRLLSLFRVVITECNKDLARFLLGFVW